MSEVGIRKDELDTPALWVDLDKMEENIVSLAVHFRDAGVAWRPHTKGIKVPAIAHKAIAAGTKVSERMKAQTNAMMTVSAIGTNVLPSTPVSVSKGT